MTDATPGTPSPADVRTDWILENLVHMTNVIAEASFVGLTISVDGQVVTGRLISASEYYRSYAAFWRTALGDSDAAGAVVQQWDELAESVKKEEKEATEYVPPAFIHLADARYVFGSNLVPTEQGLLWRGRIARVSGFSVGRLELGKGKS